MIIKYFRNIFYSFLKCLDHNVVYATVCLWGQMVCISFTISTSAIIYTKAVNFLQIVLLALYCFGSHFSVFGQTQSSHCFNSHKKHVKLKYIICMTFFLNSILQFPDIIYTCHINHPIINVYNIIII